MVARPPVDDRGNLLEDLRCKDLVKSCTGLNRVNRDGKCHNPLEESGDLRHGAEGDAAPPQPATAPPALSGKDSTPMDEEEEAA